MEKTYGPATWFKIFCWIMAIICAVFVVLLPGTIALLWLVFKAKLVVHHDRLEVTWFGTRTIPWEDFTEFRWSRGAGVLGAAMRPLAYQAGTSGRWGNIAIGAYESSNEIVETLRQKTRLALP